MATTVCLIRHGETVGAEAKRYKGHIDVPLSEKGVSQIKRLAEYLSQERSLDAVYTSSLSRAVRSAEFIAESHGLKPVIHDELKERNFGIWEGMSFDEIMEKYPDPFTAWADNPLQFSPMQGESTLDVKIRAMSSFNEIMERHRDGNIAIVSHGGIIRIILCELLGIPLENIFRIEQDFAALNVIEMWDYPVVKCMNLVV